MQELAIYKDFDLQGVIKNYELIWHRRFNDVGDYTLKISPSKESVELIKSGNIIRKGDEAAFIENLESTRESDGRVTLNVTGRFLSAMLAWRIIFLTMNGTTDTVTGAILNQNFISPQDHTRRIGNFTIKNLTVKNAVTARIEETGRLALDCIRELTQNAKVGFKVDFNVEGKTFDFSLYEGKQTKVIFTEPHRNILVQDYLYETRDYRNTVYLRSGNNTTVFGGENTGINRREIFATTNTSNTDPLADQAQAVLNRHRKIENLDSVVNMQSLQDVYRTDWDLGEIVKNHSTFWQTTIDRNILEVTEYYENKQLTLALVFGDIPNFAMERR